MQTAVLDHHFRLFTFVLTIITQKQANLIQIMKIDSDASSFHAHITNQLTILWALGSIRTDRHMHEHMSACRHTYNLKPFINSILNIKIKKNHYYENVIDFDFLYW